MKIVIPLNPAGQMRPRFTRAGIIYKHKKQRIKESMLIEHLIPHQPERPIEGPVELHVKAFLPIPSSWSKKKQRQARDGEILPTVKPDADNIFKNISDCMDKVFFKDDKQICFLSVHKYYSINPRWEIELNEI